MEMYLKDNAAANENIYRAVFLLRERGHDVEIIFSSRPEASMVSGSVTKPNHE